MSFDNIISKYKHCKIVDFLRLLNESKNKGINILPTSSQNINSLLNGGFFSGKTYILFGKNNTGKTQICHQLCVDAFINSMKSLYIDTENTFRPERIREIASAKGLDKDLILKEILTSRIMSNIALTLKLDEIKSTMKNSNIGMIIIDSINKYFRVEQARIETSFFKAKTRFLKILNQITEIALNYNVIVVLTAQVISNFKKDSFLHELPVGLNFLNHFFTEFLYLTKEEKHYSMHVINSSFLPEKRVSFKITKNGIEDPL